MVSFQFWICCAVFVTLGTGAPHQDAMGGSHPVPEDFHQTDSLEEELPGKSGEHPVPPETLESVQDHDVSSQIQSADLYVKDILLRFFKKLKNHPEILQQLIESEEKRLLDRYENMVDLEQMESNPGSSPDSVPAVENPIPVPYESEKRVVKKGGSSQMDFDPEYDPRSAPGFSGPISGSDMNNNIPLAPVNQQQNAQLSAQEIANLEKQQSQTSPFINTLPLFEKLPNPPADDKLSGPVIKADNPPTVKSHPRISQASFDSNIEEIKHVPIREELASEVPPSMLADKKELREEAHQALKKAEAEAEKTKQFQATLQQEQLEQMAKEQKAKQAQEIDQQEDQYEQQAQKQQLSHGDQQQQQPSQDSKVEQENKADPYGYYYYYYNYPELAQQVFNDDAEESNESYQPEEDSSVSDSVDSSKQQDSNDSSESEDNSSEHKDTDVSNETSHSSESSSNESDDNHISSEEVTVDDEKAQSSDKENELKALTKFESVQKENEMKNM